MDGGVTLQQMLEQALDQVRMIDSYLAWLDAGNGIKMLDKSVEEGTAEWKRKLIDDRKRNADFIAGIKADPRYIVRIESERYPEFGTY